MSLDTTPTARRSTYPWRRQPIERPAPVESPQIEAQPDVPQQPATISLGYHPETGTPFPVSDLDRQSGIYIAGVPGAGKSGELTNLIVGDANKGDKAIIVIDPHGDLTTDCIARLPEEALKRSYILDMEDEDHPFGVNIFGKLETASGIDQARAVDRNMHVFEVLWPDVLQQQHLPRYLRAATLALLAVPGSTLPVMYRFLLDDTLRAAMLKQVADEGIKDFWRTQYDELTLAQRFQRVSPLLNRLESLFLGRSLVRNIIGQSESALDFRQVAEKKEIIFVRLPVKTLAQDAKLIGTFIVAQIHAALFSFANLPQEERPGFNLYIDEFEHFVTRDIEELFTEGRKFGVCLTVAHQYRQQLPDYLQAATMTARTKLCFQVVPEDARKLAQVFPEQEVLLPEHIETSPIDWLLRRGSDDETVQCFIDYYLRPLPMQPHRNGRIEIITPGFQVDHVLDNILRGFLQLPKNREHPTVFDPTPFLNHLLYDAMKDGNGWLDIPLVVAYGFANGGRGFYPVLRYTWDKQTLLSPRFQFPPHLAIQKADGTWHWTRQPESKREQLYHFLFHLRATLLWLSKHPIGRKTRLTSFDIAQMLTQLPRRAAFVRSGDDVGVIYTNETAPAVAGDALSERLAAIQQQTRQRYCKAKTMIEEALQPEIAIDEALQETRSRWEEVD